MKIIPDGRLITHFFETEGDPVYTIIFPPDHKLTKRLELLEKLCEEIRNGIVREAELAKEKEAEGKKEKKEAIVEEIK